MFSGVERYEDTWSDEWKKSENLLTRSISIPIFVNSTKKEIRLHAKVINQIISEL